MKLVLQWTGCFTWAMAWFPDRASFIYSGIQWEADSAAIKKIPTSFTHWFWFRLSRNQWRSCPIGRLKQTTGTQKILDSNPVDFLTTWLAQPLFRELPIEVRTLFAKEVLRLPLQLSGLACSLKNILVVAPCPQFGISWLILKHQPCASWF